MHIARKALEINFWMSTLQFSCVTCRNVLPNIHHQRAPVSPSWFVTATVNYCFSATQINKNLFRDNSQIPYNKKVFICISGDYKFIILALQYMAILLELLMAITYTSHKDNCMASLTVQIGCFVFSLSHYCHIFQITVRASISPYYLQLLAHDN